MAIHDTAAARAEKEVQVLVHADASLGESLERLVRMVEDLTSSGMLGSILILDDRKQKLLTGAAPSLPAEYNAAIHGIEIGPEVGSCGTAAFHDRDVVVYDIANDPLWSNYKDVALQHGLRACWSTPIHGADGSVIGTFANYYRVVRDPSPADRELTAVITRTAAELIEQHRGTAS